MYSLCAAMTTITVHRIHIRVHYVVHPKPEGVSDVSVGSPRIVEMLWDVFGCNTHTIYNSTSGAGTLISNKADNRTDQSKICKSKRNLG